MKEKNSIQKLNANPIFSAKQGDAPEILEHPLDSIVLRDDPVTMKCRASGTGVTYTWYKNGSVLVNDKNSLVLKDGSLFLIHAAGGQFSI